MAMKPSSFITKAAAAFVRDNLNYKVAPASPGSEESDSFEKSYPEKNLTIRVTLITPASSRGQQQIQIRLLSGDSTMTNPVVNLVPVASHVGWPDKLTGRIQILDWFVGRLNARCQQCEKLLIPVQMDNGGEVGGKCMFLCCPTCQTHIMINPKFDKAANALNKILKRG